MGMKKTPLVVLAFCLAWTAFAAADKKSASELEGSAEEMELSAIPLQRGKAPGIWLQAAKLREAEAAILARDHAGHADNLLDKDFAYGEDVDDDDDLGVTKGMDSTVRLAGTADLVAVQVLAARDYLRGGMTNVAERWFADARKTTAELKKLAAEATTQDVRKKYADKAFRAENDLRAYALRYEPPKGFDDAKAGAVWLNEVDILRRRGDYRGAIAAGEKALAAKGNLPAILSSVAYAWWNIPGRDEMFAWMERAASDERWSAKDRIAAWDVVGKKASTSFRPEVMKKAIAEIKRLGGKPTGWVGSAERFFDFERFPRPEAEVDIPKDLADFTRVKPGKTITVAKPVKDELDADSALSDDTTDLSDLVVDGAAAPVMKTEPRTQDDTAVIQEAINTRGVTTVIIPNIGRPWRITSLRIHSNLRIQLEKGVRILGEEKSRCIRGADKSMFVIAKATNVVLEGLGDKPEDCFIGKFATHEERRKLGAPYSGSGISLDQVKDVLIRNLKVAYNNMDGCDIGGQFWESSNVWFADVVFDGNYRQGVSIVKGTSIYFLRSVFANTDGNFPFAGVDIEPDEFNNFVGNIYFTECRFSNNRGGGLLVAASSFWPVSVCSRRTVFEAQPSGGVVTTARTTLYVAEEHPTVGRLVFEDCTLCRWMGQGAVYFFGCPIWDMTFKNSTAKITDTRPRGSVPDGSVLQTNLSWTASWADWKKYTFSPTFDLSGLKNE